MNMVSRRSAGAVTLMTACATGVKPWTAMDSSAARITEAVNPVNAVSTSDSTAVDSVQSARVRRGPMRSAVQPDRPAPTMPAPATTARAVVIWPGPKPRDARIRARNMAKKPPTRLRKALAATISIGVGTPLTVRYDVSPVMRRSGHSLSSGSKSSRTVRSARSSSSAHSFSFSPSTMM